MPDRTLTYLDFIRLLDLIKGYALTPYSSQLITAIRPLNSLAEVNERLDSIDAILDVIRWDGEIPLSGVPDIRDIVKRVSLKDSILEAKELLELTNLLQGCHTIIGFLKRVRTRHPYIQSILERLDSLQHAYKRILKMITPEGFIQDTASYELSKIRSELFHHRDRIKRHLETIMEREDVRSVLQDSYIAIRNSRYVIPLKPNFNEFLNGIVHDYSHSLKTSFVEPVECVEINNTINILENEEKEEEKRILKELTDYLRGFLDIINRDIQTIAELDFYHSIAIFSIRFNCTRPQVSEERELYIKGAVNPFITISKKGQAVPIDIIFEGNKDAMIISGPNAGGKTVALKTIGLLSLMAQAGLYIPASDRPLIPKFPRVYAIIGDEQDISMDLSSFSGHMLAVKEIYEGVSGGEMVLIDEIGGGTDPQEASALSMAIIDAFIEKGCRVVVTTHLDLLKSYGYTKPFAINVATAFDHKAMRPLYRLTYGVAGSSNAIKIAENIQMPEEIINKSIQYLGRQGQMLDELVTSLEIGKKEVEEEKEAILRRREQLKRRLSLLNEKREEMLTRFEDRVSKRFMELEIEIEEIRKEVSKKERASLKKGKERLRALEEKMIKTTRRQEEVINVGDYVNIRSMGSNGQVIGISADGDMVEVVIGNMKTKVNRLFVEKARNTPTPNNPISAMSRDRVDIEPLEGPELNIMGMRVDDAMKEVDRFIDKAIVEGIQKVRILHGIGTGRLMNAVKEHLTKAAYIKEIRMDARNKGVTIIELS